jgi:predicted nucleotidyltransferase
MKHIKLFEDFQSMAISGLYDTGAQGAYGRWKNENPAIEMEEIIKDTDIDKYKSAIKKIFNGYKENTSLNDYTIKDIEVVGSYGTDKWKKGKSDIDFVIELNGKVVHKFNTLRVIKFINKKLKDLFGEIKNDKQFIEVVGIYDEDYLNNDIDESIGNY